MPLYMCHRWHTSEYGLDILDAFRLAFGVQTVPPVAHFGIQKCAAGGTLLAGLRVHLGHQFGVFLIVKMGASPSEAGLRFDPKTIKFRGHERFALSVLRQFALIVERRTCALIGKAGNSPTARKASTWSPLAADDANKEEAR
jgi:hypothetical protein